MKLGDWAYFLAVKREYIFVVSSCWLTLKNGSGGHTNNSCYAIELQVQVHVCACSICVHTSWHVHANECYKNCDKICAIHVHPMI